MATRTSVSPSSTKGKDVGCYRSPCKRRSQPEAQPQGKSALPHEVAGQQGQQEQADIAHDHPIAEMEAEQFRQLDRQRSAHRQRQHHQRLGARSPARLTCGRRHHQLLPQPLGVLTGKLARDLVQAPHALDGHQERFIGCEPGVNELGDPVAQVALHFLDVRAFHGAAPAQERTPLRDLLLYLISELRSYPNQKHFRPDAAQRVVDRLPLPPLRLQMGPAPWRDAVVLAAASAVGPLPARGHVTQPLQPVQHRVKHAVGPLQPPARKLGHALENGIPVTVPLRQDGQHQRGGRSRDEILTDVHT